MALRLALERGQTVGGFRIESFLARGGMGAVYLATQVRLGRKVALKVLAPEWADDEEFRARFTRESELAASLEKRSAELLERQQAGVVALAAPVVEITEEPACLARLSARPSVRPGQALHQGLPGDGQEFLALVLALENLVDDIGGGIGANGEILHENEQVEEVWTGTTFGVASHMMSEGMRDEAFKTAQGVNNVVWKERGYWFRTPEAYDSRGLFRASMYMRPGAIWAMEMLPNSH